MTSSLLSLVWHNNVAQEVSTATSSSTPKVSMTLNDFKVLRLVFSTIKASLRFDATAVVRKSDEDHSSDGSPTSAITSCSPTTTSFDNHQSPQELDRVKSEDERELVSGPIRSQSGSSAKSDKEKRKRSRVTQEQLVHLERYFKADHNPTATRRREISEQLGMQERQTQIWFQNRRAKAKLQKGKKSSVTEVSELSPDNPPELSAGFEAELYSLIHEDGRSWRRIATQTDKHALLAYVCEVKRCLTWYIKSAGYGFKMEIPFDTIINTDFQNAAPGSGVASFILSKPPIFYLEHVSPSSPAERLWEKCADWTEGRQATHVLRHTLIGSAVQLVHLLRDLNTRAVGSDITLYHPSTYQRLAQPSPLIALPSPPLAPYGLSGPVNTERFWKRSEFSSPNDGARQLPPRSEPPTSRPPHSPPYNEYHHQNYTSPDYGDGPILQRHPAPYPVQSISLPYYSSGLPPQQFDQDFEHNA
ncbi:hypothetical protein K443DRAFT_118259 [Laccaria amethystina LaAM-08-1]|uniref:Homeobox domain-containing protein n=1 Tax=Laccaria amethystina LaAM-08-1 TaxID=1095629 RepID=A0A0C9YJ08_9AGAR|nr:hypothetical protein K443DRAFT_118259 [Laccaria amethystina LaAM-08-1]